MLPAGGMTSFIGRQELLDDVVLELERSRLVTLTGPGGVGKTRLAVEVAHRCATRFGGGSIAVAYLAAVRKADALAREVLAALRITHQGNTPVVDALVEHLRDRPATLLVLDNCERLWDEVAELLSTLVREVPHLVVLATSRRHLEVGGEQVVHVPPLPIPSEDDHDSGAMTLLLDRARSAGAAISDDGRQAAVALARWSGGLPLVLELIAVRLGGGMSPDAVLARLDGGRLLSARDTRRVRPHHQVLQEVFDWSYELCSPGERRLWARISVFAGGFDLDSVEEVCGGGEVVDLVDGLVRKSLVSSQNGRYQQLEPIREYGLRRLQESGEEQRLRESHRDHFRRLAAAAAENWFGPDEVGRLTRTAVELNNFRAALDFCACPEHAEIGLEIAVNLARLRLWFFEGLLGEGCMWLKKLLDLTPAAPAEVRAGATAMLGWILLCQGEQAAAAVQLAACRDLAAEFPDFPPVLFLAGVHAMLVEGDPVCVPLLTAAHERYLAMGPPMAGDAASVQLMLGLGAGFDQHEETARALAAEGLAATSASGAPWAIGWSVWVKGIAPLTRGEPAEAAALFQDGLAAHVEIDDKWGTTWGAEAIAWTFAALGLHEEAAVLLGGTVRMQEKAGVKISGVIPFARERDRAVAAITAALGDEAYHAAYRKGQGLSAAEVMALALRRVPREERRGPGTTLADLTRRERDIAIMISQGRTNAEMAQALFRSTRTVDAHVRRIFDKANLRNRALVAAWVAEQLTGQE
jgi:predicted ATPase/DNA-binding CsgD family transcriptional regulator